MGMMPSSEIELRKTFIDKHGLKISIDAGKNGWTIQYADHSSKYEDVEATTEDNFNTALKVLKSNMDVVEYKSNDDEDEELYES